MDDRFFPNRRQYCLRAVFVVLTLVCMAASLWQWGPGRVYLSAAAAFLVLSSAHLAIMVGGFRLVETLLPQLAEPSSCSDRAASSDALR